MEAGREGVTAREKPCGSGQPLCEREAALPFDGCVFVPACVCDNPEIEKGLSVASASPSRLRRVGATNCSWKEKLNSLEVLVLFSLIQVPPAFLFCRSGDQFLEKSHKTDAD